MMAATAPFMVVGVPDLIIGIFLINHRDAMILMDHRLTLYPGSTINSLKKEF
jgi:hypothetical protein